MNTAAVDQKEYGILFKRKGVLDFKCGEYDSIPDARYDLAMNRLDKSDNIIKFGEIEFIDGDNYYDLPQEVKDVFDWWFVEKEVKLNEKASQQACEKILQLGHPCEEDMGGDIILWNWKTHNRS